MQNQFPNAQPQQKNEQLPKTELFRQNLLNNKKLELDKEMQKYLEYCILSRDLENLLKLHNFLLSDSFKEVTAIYERFVKRLSSDNEVDGVKSHILNSTFDLLFKEYAFDLFNDFSVQISVAVPQEKMESKEFYSVQDIRVLYKGNSEDELYVGHGLPQVYSILQDVNDKLVPFDDIKSYILSHPIFIETLFNQIHAKLADHAVANNTIFFAKESKHNYYNASDFKKMLVSGQFKKYILSMEDVHVFTQLIQN
jgi:hypothetical protein